MRSDVVDEACLQPFNGKNSNGLTGGDEARPDMGARSVRLNG